MGSYLDSIKRDLVSNPKLKQPITERTRTLRKKLLDTTPTICSERALLYTKSWKETERYAVVIRRAKALEKVLAGMSIMIHPGELIVGNHANGLRATPVFPEFNVDFILEELDGNPYRFDERPGDRFLVSDEAANELREIAGFWLGKTMNEYKRSLLTDEVRNASYEIRAFDVWRFGECGGSGHLIPGYPKVLTKGLNGIITEVEDQLNGLEIWKPDALEKKSEWEAMLIALKAAANFSKRFAVLARDMAQREANPQRKHELEKIAEHCDWVPANPPRTFWEAMQSLWFVRLMLQLESDADSMSFGRFDQYMYPFYEKDMAAGRITPQEIVELIECLWIKITELNKLKAWIATRDVSGYIIFQNLTIGGQTVNGESAINDLTYLTLEATENQKLTQPSVSVRWWSGCPDEFLLKCCEAINVHRGGQPAMHNDQVIIPSQLAVGISVQDAYDYAIVGCVEPSEPGKSRRVGIAFTSNLPKILELTLNNGRDPRTGIQMAPNPESKDLATFESFDELRAALKHQSEYYARLGLGGINAIEKAYAERTPTPFLSTLVEDCIKLGKDNESGGAHYTCGANTIVGFQNSGNSLAAIKRLVFEQKSLTGSQILHALETNFGDMSTSPTGPEIQQMLLSAPKYGNDDDYVDFLVKEAADDSIWGLCNLGLTDWQGGTLCRMAVPVTINISFGAVCGATPDGRKSGVPVAEGCSPVRGTDVKGPTAAVKSVAKLNHLQYDCGILFNQKFSPDMFRDASNLRKLAGLIKTFFDLWGQHIQFNVVSVDTLKDAQKHPERYTDLMVRVAGYSALFTVLSPECQEDIILRTEQTFE